MAVSLESAALLHVLCDTIKPARVLDLGSGFSSFVLRRWREQTGSDTRIVSVDDDAAWLERTGQYLSQQQLPTHDLFVWSDFVDLETDEPFDLVFHDGGSMRFRLEQVAFVCSETRKGGMLLLDDMHKPDYRRGALACLERQGVDAYSLKSWTHDPFSRFAYLALP